MKLMMIWLTVSAAALAGCGKVGDFCDVVPGAKQFAPETARLMVKTDRPDVEQIRVENDYGAEHCDW